MKLVESDFALSPLEDPDRPRSPGLHLSSILRSIQADMGTGGLRPLDSPFIYTPEIEDGFTFEALMYRIWKLRMGRRHFQMSGQLEIEKDGILMTIDDFDHLRKKVLEYKRTKRSLKKMQGEDRLRHFWSWFHQVMSYCSGMGVNEAELYVYFVNGDYSWGKGDDSMSATKLYEITFTDDELKRNWDMILKRANQMRGQQ